LSIDVICPENIILINRFNKNFLTFQRDILAEGTSVVNTIKCAAATCLDSSSWHQTLLIFSQCSCMVRSKVVL
jgi:hypothetical protein